MASPDGDPLRTARLAREASERARAEALIAAKRQEMDGGASSVASTPRTDVGSYSDQYYREDVREAHRKRESEEDVSRWRGSENGRPGASAGLAARVCASKLALAAVEAMKY